RVLATRVARQCHFVLRFPRPSVLAVKAFWLARDQEREVTREVTSKARAYVAEHQLPTTLRMRLITVVLASGEVEVLGRTCSMPSPIPPRSSRPCMAGGGSRRPIMI